MNKPSLIIEIPGKPLTKKNQHRTKRKSKALYLPKEVSDYEEMIHEIGLVAMREAGWPGPWTGRITVGADIRFNSWHEKDVQNYWDSLLDGLSGAAYDDDCQIDRAVCCRQKSSENPGITVYLWFHDFDLNELGTRRPREWVELSVLDILAGAPEVYPVVTSPDDCTNMVRYAEYGMGRKKEERARGREAAAAKRAKSGTRQRKKPARKRAARPARRKSSSR